MANAKENADSDHWLSSSTPNRSIGFNKYCPASLECRLFRYGGLVITNKMNHRVTSYIIAYSSILKRQYIKSALLSPALKCQGCKTSHIWDMCNTWIDYLHNSSDPAVPDVYHKFTRTLPFTGVLRSLDPFDTTSIWLFITHSLDLVISSI